MGIAVPSQLFGRQHLILSTMKAFAAAALVATASAAPEAKPWLGYGAAVVPIDPHATSGELVTIGDAQVPDTTLAVKAAAADHLAAKSLHYGAYGAYGGYGLPLAGHLWKRDADAKPEADAYYGYGGLYGYGKRSADAEAKPEADAWYGYGGLYGYGLGLGYGGYGYGGLYGYGKRSADADAKPWLGYGGLYGGWAYGVPALVAHPNGAVTPPYTAAQVAAAADHFAAKGKRSADAFYGYGGYGLGLGYGYGGYGYLG